MVESRVGKSLSCQATVVCNAREPLRMMEMPSGPWKKGRVDFAGPFPIKEMALVFWDQYARYPVVEFVTTTSADSVIPLFTRVFNRHVIPEEIESDNGPPFNGSKFSNFAREQGLRRRKVTPAWAEERFIQTLKKSAKIARQSQNRPQTSFRFGRELHRNLPERMVRKEGVSSDPIGQRDTSKKKQMKTYVNEREMPGNAWLGLGITSFWNRTELMRWLQRMIPDLTQL